jgi:ribose transport system permease protein
VYYDPAYPINNLMNNPSDVPFWMPPIGVAFVAVLAVVMAFVMKRTIYGRHLFAVGSNEAAARLCGIRTRRLQVLTYTLAGFIYGLAGLMQLSRLQQGSPTVAVGLELDVIAAVVIGGASLSGGTGSIFGSLIGALIMAVLRNGTQLMGWENYVQEIIIGGVIILAVGIDRFRQRGA